MVHFGSFDSKFNAPEIHFMFMSKRHLSKCLTLIHTRNVCEERVGTGGRQVGNHNLYIGFDTIVFNIRLVLKWVRQFESMLCGDQSGQSNDKERKCHIRHSVYHSMIHRLHLPPPLHTFPPLLLFASFFPCLERLIVLILRQTYYIVYKNIMLATNDIYLIKFVTVYAPRNSSIENVIVVMTDDY